MKATTLLTHLMPYVKCYALNVFGFLILFSSSSTAQVTEGGPDCATAAANMVTLPYNGVGHTTCTKGDDVNGQTIVNQDCLDPTYFEGEEYLYVFKAPASGIIMANFVANVALYSSLGVWEGCPTDVGSRCVAASYFDLNTIPPTPIRNVGFWVEKDHIYYLVVDMADDQATNGEDCVPSYNIIIPYPDTTCVQVIAKAQDNSGRNADFEAGSFKNWKRFTGNCCPINATNSSSNTFTGRFEITKGTGRDDNTEGRVAEVCPDGGKYSARLGNSNVGAQAERAEFKFKVTPESNGLLYKYAAVLQDPGHDPSQQPRFEVTIKGLKDSKCGNYKVIAGEGAKCFLTYQGIQYKDWTTVGVDFSSPYYLDKEITVNFAVGDCAAQGHFGYAYLDVAMIKMAIDVQGENAVADSNYADTTYVHFCKGAKNLTLLAPDGFRKYNWSTAPADSVRAVVIAEPKGGQIYTVTLRSEHGFQCPSTLACKLIELDLPESDFAYLQSCAGKETGFTDQTTAGQGKLTKWNWNLGDGAVDSVQNPVHTYTSPGVYEVKLTTTNQVGCAGEITKTVEVLQPLQVTAVSDKQAIAPCETANLSVTAAGGKGPYTFIWSPDIGAGKGPFPVQQLAETYYFVTVTDESNCDDVSDTVLVMKGEGAIQFKLPNAFSPNADGMNDEFKPGIDCAKTFRMRIFDRWGKLIFTTDNPGTGWNPASEGNNMASTYVYIIDVTDFEDRPYSYTGTVSLTR